MRGFLLTLGLVLCTIAQSQLKSPSEFLGYELGSRFSRHHQVVSYYKYLEVNSPNVQLRPYGETYEGRPLMLAMVSSQDNLNNLEKIRTSNLKRTGLMDGTPEVNDVAIVWLSYNIHGNEASSIEASMKTIHALLTDGRAEEWLTNTVVILDPCINPDGRDRYANFYNQYGSRNFNPNRDDLEHNEPWPGGRPNHYLFDLNRDWAWQTQIESQSRSVVYHEWMPHIHVDFHEQFVDNPYYFAPAAEPYHEIITDWQRQFQTVIGKNHAKYFDQEGWLYFTKERFDLLYPSYGDTYPTYNGAIGMTYEQAGHGRAGLGIYTEFGDTLTLKDRIAHHYTTGLSTVEIASLNASRLVSEFDKYFTQAVQNPVGSFKTYVVSAKENPNKVRELTKFLDKHKITYGLGSSRKSVRAYDYQTNSYRNMTFTDELVISTYQPMSRLVTALFEPNTKLSDSLTYDITAWALPYAYGLKGYALTERISPSKKYVFRNPEKVPDKAYAYLARYDDISDAQFASYLHKSGVNLRASQSRLTFKGQTFHPGTLVITRRNNEHLGKELINILNAGATEFGVELFPVETGFAQQGPDLGSDQVRRMPRPRIAVVGGNGVRSYNFGEIWYFFERVLDYPITRIASEDFNYIQLSSYNTLILPEGRYRMLSEDFLEELKDWVSSGGKLIVVGSAIREFRDAEGFGLKQDKEKKERNSNGSGEVDLIPYDRLEREDLNNSIFGAIYKVRLDPTHPLAFGYGDTYFSLKTNSFKVDLIEYGQNVGYLKGQTEPVSGFAGWKANEALDNSLVFGVYPIGRGEVIYLVDNPLFRAFWQSGHLLFANAVLMSGN